jgi:hypothetical protein
MDYIWGGPVICKKHTAAPLECFTDPEIAAIPVFYFGTQAVGFVLVRIARRSGWIPTPQEKSPEFKSDLYLANHIPSVLICARIGACGLLVLRDVWARPNFNGLFSAHGDEGAMTLDAQMWFTGYLALETGINVISRHIGTELLVHHYVFGVISMIVLYHGGLTGMVAVLLAQEVSTVPLNFFLIVRGFCGMQAHARMWFLVFTASFLPVRIGLAGYCSAGFVDAWLGTGLSASIDWTPGYAPWEQIVLVLGVSAGMVMQLIWARTMVKRVLKPWFEGKKID